MEICKYVCFYAEGGELLILNENRLGASELGLCPHITDESQAWYGGLGSDSPKATQLRARTQSQDHQGFQREEYHTRGMGVSAPFFPENSNKGGVGSHSGFALLWRHVILFFLNLY